MTNKNTPTNNDPSANETAPKPERPKCGIIMPISAIDGMLPGHWEDVKGILREAIDFAGFESELVSETEESTIIHKTIVQNLYNNQIVVCDVSGKNPNVMFELGIRLTFDKPTVVVKDNETDYSFDTSPIEYVGYPRDLHYHQIVQFKEKLAAKVKATHEAGKHTNYSTFLKHFGQFTVPKLEQQEVSPDQFIIERLEELTQTVRRLERSSTREGQITLRHHRQFITLDASRITADEFETLKTFIHVKYPEAALRWYQDTLRVYYPSGWSIPAVERCATDLQQILDDWRRERDTNSPALIEVPTSKEL